MSTYKHEGQDLDRHIAEEIVKDLLTGTKLLTATESIANITKCVLAHHTQQGGLPLGPESKFDSYRDLERSMWSYMRILQSNGYARHVYDDRWEIYQPPLRVFGVGSGAVYLYYNPKERVADCSNWICKVGSHNKSKIDAVRDYVDLRTTNWATRATLALILKTDIYKRLENQIMTILRDVLERQDKREGKYSREMFKTNPDEVIEIYKLINRLYKTQPHQNLFKN